MNWTTKLGLIIVMRAFSMLLAIGAMVAAMSGEGRGQEYLPRYDAGCSPRERAEAGLLAPPCILDRDYEGRPFYRLSAPLTAGLPPFVPTLPPAVPYNERTFDLFYGIVGPFR